MVRVTGTGWFAAVAALAAMAGAEAAAQPTASQTARMVAPPVAGLWVVGLELGSQADTAGLALLDILTSYDGKPTPTAAAWAKAAAEAPADRPIPVTFVRDGRPMTVAVRQGRMGVWFTPLLDPDAYEFARRLTPAKRRAQIEADAAFRAAGERVEAGDYPAAVPHYLDALRRHEDTGDSPSALRDRTGLGWAYQYVGEYEEARKVTERALADAVALGDEDAAASAHYGLGWYYNNAARFVEARRHFDKALAIRQRQQDPGAIANTLNALGVIDIELADFEAAKTRLEKALAMAEQVGHRRTIASIAANLALAYRRLNDFKKAIELLNRASAINREDGNLEGLGGCAASMAAMWNLLGEPRQAALSWLDALKAARRMGYVGGEIEARTGLASIQGALGEPENALKNFAEAERLAVKSGYHDALWRARFLRGQLLEAQGKNEEALADYLKAVEGIEAVRANLTAGRLTDAAQRHTEKKSYVYEALVLLLLKMDRHKEALEYLERGKSRMLLEGLKVRSIQTGDEQLTALLGEAARLQERLAELEAQRLKSLTLAAADPAAAARLSTLIAATEAEFIQVQDRLVKTYGSEFNDLIKVQPTYFIDVADSIPPRTLLVEYFPAPDKLIVFLVARDAFRIKEVAIARDELYRLVRTFRNEMRPGRAQTGIGERLKAAILQLHDALITPLEDDFKAYRTILVIPSGLLYYLPFHALAREREGKLEFVAERPIQMAYLTRAGLLTRALGNQAEKGGARPVGVLAFGNPAGSDPPLPAAEAEAASVVAVFPNSKAFVGAQATEARAKLLTDQASIVHFAAHARLNHGEPVLSHVALAGGQGEDGALTEGEIYGIKLAGARLVVLSGCETALAEDDPGKEVASLARAFSFAKVPSILASLWQVDDPATALLMKTFYTGLAAGLSKTEALRCAQVAVLTSKDSYRHPYFWAPFILIGAWE